MLRQLMVATLLLFSSCIFESGASLCVETCLKHGFRSAKYVHADRKCVCTKHKSKTDQGKNQFREEN